MSIPIETIPIETIPIADLQAAIIEHINTRGFVTHNSHLAQYELRMVSRSPLIWPISPVYSHDCCSPTGYPRSTISRAFLS